VPLLHLIYNPSHRYLFKATPYYEDIFVWRTSMIISNIFINLGGSYSPPLVAIHASYGLKDIPLLAAG
jgi:hypothetical protein